MPRLDSLLWERIHGQLVPLLVWVGGVSWVELGKTEFWKVLAKDEAVGRSQLLHESRAFEGELGKPSKWNRRQVDRRTSHQLTHASQR